MLKLIKKYEEIVLYGLFGICTTIINILTYYILAHILNLSTITSTILAWIVAVSSAFVLIKEWVFKSKTWDKNVVKNEIILFFSCRIFTGFIDLVIMYVFVDILKLNDIIIKIIANIIVILLNYIANKLIIFNKKYENVKK